MTDILDDLKNKLKEIGFVDPKIEKVIIEVRREWAGERAYIGTRYELNKLLSERNRNIIRDYKAGESIIFLSRRYGLSRQQIHNIIKG